MKIKICGLSRKEDIAYVNEAKPDIIGFVFAPSKRQVSVNQAKMLKEQLDKSIQTAGVFVNANIDVIKEIADQGILDFIQLHGQEDTAYIKALKQVVSLPIIKAISIMSREDLHQRYDVDYYLLDYKKAGSGERFDWSWITKLDKPFFLAGGVNLSNLDEALQHADYGIDVSSGVESDGKKDGEKIKELVRRIRNGNR